MLRFRPRRSLALVPAAALLLAGIASGRDYPAAGPGEWPQWRGPNRDAVSRETGLLQSWPAAGPPLAWKAAGVGAGYSSLAVAGGRIFTLGDLGGSQVIVARALSDPLSRLFINSIVPTTIEN